MPAFPEILPVALPIFGVVKTGEVPNTAAPVPVSSVNAPDKLADVNEPREVALPTEVTAPVRFALVVTFPAVNPAAVPVIFVPTKVEGVPKLGVTRVGEVFITKVLPVPVCEATEVALPTEVMGPVKLASVVTVAALPVMLPTIGLVTVRSVSVPKLVSEEAVTPEAKVVPVSVPAAAVTVMFPVPSKETPLIVLAV